MRFLRVFLVLLSIAGCLLLFCAVYFGYQSFHEGTEFSPDDFSTRGFSYYKEPAFGIVIRGREYTTKPFYSMPDLVADGFIKPVFKKDKTWHLVTDNSASSLANAVSHNCDARFLVDFLDETNGRYESTWEVWNTDHPKLAKVFWPPIAEMARDEAYLVICDVMTFALDSTITDPIEFKQELDLVVAKAYLQLGQVRFENGDPELADHLVSKAEKYFSSPDSKALLKQIRSTSNGDMDTANEPKSTEDK